LASAVPKIVTVIVTSIVNSTIDTTQGIAKVSSISSLLSTIIIQKVSYITITHTLLRTVFHKGDCKEFYVSLLVVLAIILVVIYRVCKRKKTYDTMNSAFSNPSFALS